MKTLIINPPTVHGFERSGRWPSKSTGGACQEPLFLAYAAAILEKENLDVELIDCRPTYISIKDLLKRITNDVGLIIIQTSTPSIDMDLETAKIIKEKFPNVKIVLVGSHPTVLDKEIMLANEHIDIIARGEYDYTIRDIAKNVQENKSLKSILGITFREQGNIMRTMDRPLIQNIDDLPFPARHFLPVEKYFEPLFIGRPTLRLISSRGCPFRCTYCLWPQVMYGRGFRGRDPKKVVDEIEYIKNKFKIKEYYFDDDTFTVNPERVKTICDEIVNRGINLPFDCLGRVDTINREMLESMKKAGCIIIRYGVESGNQGILDRCHKMITLDQMRKAFKLTHEIGIQTHATVMFGLPGETRETIKETIDFVLELEPDYVQFAIATPYPGTEFYKEAEKEGWLIAKKWTDFDPIHNSVIEYPNLSKKEIEEAVITAYKKFYLRSKYILKRVKNIKSIGQIGQFLKGGVNLLKNVYVR